jgi:hypothetical protein
MLRFSNSEIYTAQDVKTKTVHARKELFLLSICSKLMILNNLGTDKKENKIFLVYKEIQKGSVAKSYMRKGS